MRAFRILVNAFIICFVLPVFIVGLLSLAFSPVQAAAWEGVPHVVLEAQDIPA